MKIIVSILRITAAVLAFLLIFGAAVFVAVRQPTVARDQAVSPRASAERMRRDVMVLSETFRPRSAARPENLARSAAYIGEELARAGARVTHQRFRARGAVYENVIATFGSGDQPALVVGAHYDAFSERGELPGADDNASGTAGLLELARVLGRTPPRGRVDLVAYANEEPPFFASDGMGSVVHAGSLGPHRPAMICLEMIGYFSARQPKTGSLLDWMVPSSGDFVVATGRWRDRRLARTVTNALNSVSGARAIALILPPQLGTDASDHRSYWAHGSKAVMITDTAYIRNPNYHTANDTAETLDYARMARVIDGVALAVWRLSE